MSDTTDPARKPVCGHTTKPCTDPKTWCLHCGTPPCCEHLTDCRRVRGPS